MSARACEASFSVAIVEIAVLTPRATREADTSLDDRATSEGPNRDEDHPAPWLQLGSAPRWLSAAAMDRVRLAIRTDLPKGARCDPLSPAARARGARDRARAGRFPGGARHFRRASG